MENEFIFKSIQNDKIKILCLIKNNNILVGTFPKSSSIQFQRLLLIHIFLALINFKGDFVQFSKKLNEYEQYNKNSYLNLKTFYAKEINNLPSKELNNILELLIFEYYFLKTLILHFSKVFNEMFKKEDLNLKQTKFRNLYLMDINSLSVILDMCKIQGQKSAKKNKKYYKYENLFEEIIYHSKNLYNEYLKENEMRYSSIALNFRFVKFECTSTYPRLLFIIKFIPVIKGIAVIHIYSQKKISRNNENTMKLEQGLNCQEVDLLFGSFIRDNPNFEFKYGAPKKLEYIEKFLEEFFVTGRNNLGIFRLINPDKKFIYVNYDIINIINTFQISNNANIDQIFNDINKNIEKDYEKEQKEKNERINNNDDSDSNYDNNEDGKDMKILNNLLSLTKIRFYQYFFNKTKINNNVIKEKNINKISSSKEENKSNNNLIGVGNNIDNLGKNININEIINSNSERKNLINNENKENKTLSLYTSEDNNNFKDNKSSQKNSKNVTFSKISEVKTNEKFEIKVINIKEMENKNNKEDTKDKISELSSNKEKELNLNELLERMNSSKKINQYNNENKNNIIKEDFEENELTKKEITNSSKIIKSSISKKKISKIVLVNRSKRPLSGSSRSSLIKD